MIFAATPTIIGNQTFYSLARVEISMADEKGSTAIGEEWYTIPAARTLHMGVNGGKDIFQHTPDSQVARLKACAEYLADDTPGLMARHLRLARLCVRVFYGEPDGNGDYQSESLEDYITSGKDPLDIVATETAGDYFKAS